LVLLTNKGRKRPYFYFFKLALTNYTIMWYNSAARWPPAEGRSATPDPLGDFFPEHGRLVWPLSFFPKFGPLRPNPAKTILFEILKKFCYNLKKHFFKTA